jgi:DNA-binding CsgD family transcriptional regulator
MKQLILKSDYEVAMKKVAIITPEELKLVKAMGEGKSAEDLKREWKRSLHTIKNRMYALRVKTGYRKNTLLVAAFKDQGLI